MARPTGRPIRDEILDASRELAQSVGVGHFSYADLAERVGVSAPSIHHHFAKKEDLLIAVAHRYRNDFAAELAELNDQASTAVSRLHGYRALFDRVATGGGMCLCGAAAADWASLGPGVQREVEAFFDDQVTWLTGVVAEGVTTGEFSADLDPSSEAVLILCALEGATLVARTNGRVSLDTILNRLVDSMTP